MRIFKISYCKDDKHFVKNENPLPVEIIKHVVGFTTDPGPAEHQAQQSQGRNFGINAFFVATAFLK